MRIKPLVLLTTTLLLSNTTYADPRVLTTKALANDNDKYAFEMLQLALSYSPGKYKLTPENATDKTAGRNISDLMSGATNAMWTATDQEIEEQILPVRIPLYKGLLGYRVFLINKNNLEKFRNINTFDDLKTLKFGQGTGWADTKILEANGLKVVKTVKYPSLIYMTDGGRFDAFPRGVHEPWGEMKNYPKLDLMVEPNLMLVYKMPFYIFVNKNDGVLAKDIEHGFNQAIADGSFDKHFYANPAVKEVIENANMHSRKIFELKNPSLPEKTPVDRAELWVDITKF